MTSGKRLGVASVVGMVFMVLIFMAAIGAQVYLSGVQFQSSQAEGATQQRMALRSQESLAFSAAPSGLFVTDTGPTGETLVAIILKFENGTIYNLDSVSSPPFASATVASTGGVPVQPLIPAGVCSPGTATCLSKYNSVVGGSPVAGRALGLVTSMGNTFWYVPSASAASADPAHYRVSTNQATTSTTFVPLSGLSFSGTPNTFYWVQVYIAYFQSSSSNPSILFAISVPTGTTFLFCGGMDWADPAQATTDFAPGNFCSVSQGTSLGRTVNTQTFCTQQNSGMCEFTGWAYVSFGTTPGNFQMEFAGSSTDTATVVAGSSIVVTPT